MVINFSSLRKKKKIKSQPQIKAFPGKWQNVSCGCSSRDTQQVPLPRRLSIHQTARRAARAGEDGSFPNFGVHFACRACWLGLSCLQTRCSWLLKLCREAQELSMHAPACTSMHHEAAQPSALRSSSPHLPGQVRILPQPRAMQGFSDMLEPIIFKGFVQLLELLPQMQRKGVKPHLLRARQQSSICSAS